MCEWRCNTTCVTLSRICGAPNGHHVPPVRDAPVAHGKYQNLVCVFALNLRETV